MGLFTSLDFQLYRPRSLPTRCIRALQPVQRSRNDPARITSPLAAWEESGDLGVLQGNVVARDAQGRGSPGLEAEQQGLGGCVVLDLAIEESQASAHPGGDGLGKQFVERRGVHAGEVRCFR